MFDNINQNVFGQISSLPKFFDTQIIKNMPKKLRPKYLHLNIIQPNFLELMYAGEKLTFQKGVWHLKG